MNKFSLYAKMSINVSSWVQMIMWKRKEDEIVDLDTQQSSVMINECRRTEIKCAARFLDIVYTMRSCIFKCQFGSKI